MLFKLSLFIVFLLIFISCKDHKNSCSIYGKLKNAEKVKHLFLVDVNSDITDTINVINGEFQLNIHLDHPKYFIIRNERNEYQFRDRKYIWLEPSEIKINGDFEFLNNLEVTGSKSHAEFLEYNQLLSNENNQINKLKEQFRIAADEIDKINITSVIDSMKKERNKKIVDFLKINNHSHVSLSSLYFECFYANMNLSKEEIALVFNNLNNDLKETSNGKIISNYLSLPAVPQVGEKALEFALPNLTGDTIKLSDYKGKFVLVDFWASWCSPCRDSNNELVKIYKKYNSRGFEILGVSGDLDRKDWVNSIMRDSIKWENVADLKGWHNEVFLLYDIKFIPNNILINPDGIIIGKTYCNMKVLDKELYQLLNKNVL